MTKKKYPEGMIECIECNGIGKKLETSAGLTSPCETCEGKGCLKCEHWNQDGSDCLDCGKNLAEEQADAMDAQFEAQVDDRIMERKEKEAKS